MSVGRWGWGAESESSGGKSVGGWSIGVDTGVQSAEGISDGVGVLRCGRSVRVGWEWDC